MNLQILDCKNIYKQLKHQINIKLENQKII